MTKQPAKDLSFEDALKQLESIVARLESGDLMLDEAMRQFEIGIKLARMGQKHLEQAEQRIQMLLADGEQGKLTDFSVHHDD